MTSVTLLDPTEFYKQKPHAISPVAISQQKDFLDKESMYWDKEKSKQRRLHVETEQLPFSPLTEKEKQDESLLLEFN